MISENWTQRKVQTSALKTQMKAEFLKWLQLLLQLIDVTADKADLHLRKFVRGRGIAKDFHKDISDTVSGLGLVATLCVVFPITRWSLPLKRIFHDYRLTDSSHSTFPSGSGPLNS